MLNFDEFLSAYVAALLWSSPDEKGDFLDAAGNELSPEAQAACVADCRRFVSVAGDDMTHYLHLIKPVPTYTASDCAGHDFWLTRAGHGVGFWDRGLGELGDRLSALCGHGTQFPNREPYIGDDQKVYLS